MATLCGFGKELKLITENKGGQGARRKEGCLPFLSFTCLVFFFLRCSNIKVGERKYKFLSSLLH